MSVHTVKFQSGPKIADQQPFYCSEIYLVLLLKTLDIIMLLSGGVFLPHTVDCQIGPKMSN